MTFKEMRERAEKLLAFDPHHPTVDHPVTLLAVGGSFLLLAAIFFQAVGPGIAP